MAHQRPAWVEPVEARKGLMKWLGIAGAVALYYLVCLGIDLLPWNKDAEEDRGDG